MATPPSKGRLLYHMTHISNLPSILEKGLRPRKELLIERNAFEDVADPEILFGRENYQVDLTEYVPFHFFAKNPFDGAVCNRFGANNMAIVSIWRPDDMDSDFFIIPEHPLAGGYPRLYPYKEGFHKVNWTILDDPINRDYHDQKVKNACMAECVVSRVVMPSEIAYVFVFDDEAKRLILKTTCFHPGKIETAPNMFP